MTDVYLSADDGDDDAGGGVDDPLASLAGVRDLLIDTESDQAMIHIDPGEYRETHLIDWDGVPQHRLTFESTGTDDDRPVFDGTHAVTARDEHYLMRTDNGPSLEIHDLLVRNYGTGAVRIIGVDDNVVTNTIFENLGNSHISGTDGYGALHLKDSSNNTCSHNDFRNLVNDVDECPGCIHGVYLAQSSNGNTITDNTFDHITGDPVRLVDDVNDSDISGNTFLTSDIEAMVSFWRFESSDECGTDNHVGDNVYDGRDRDGDDGQPITDSGAKGELDACDDAVVDNGNDLDDDA